MIHCKGYKIKANGLVHDVVSEFTWLAMHLASEKQIYKKFKIPSENNMMNRVAEVTIQYLKDLDKIVKGE